MTDDATPDHSSIEQGEIEQAEAMMREAQQRLAGIPAEVVVANHAMGLYELGAIHLSSEPPNLPEAALAIDALACLVEGLGDRLGADAPTFADALSNIRLAFVQIKSRMLEEQAAADEAGSAG